MARTDTLPPHIQQALGTLTGARVPVRPGLPSLPPGVGTPPKLEDELSPKEKIAREFADAIRKSPEAVDAFFSQYGQTMDAPTWRLIYDRLVEGFQTVKADEVFEGGNSLGDVWRKMRVAGFQNGVFISQEPTTWANLTSQIQAWLATAEGQSALGDSEIDIDALVDRARKEGKSASEIAELEGMATPARMVSELLAQTNPAELIELNPHLGTAAEIPSGSVIFMSPRSTPLAEGETLQDVAARAGIPLETLVAYNQRQFALEGKPFDPDKTYPGQPIYIPPSSFGASPEQAYPVTTTTPQATPTQPVPRGEQMIPGQAPVGPPQVPGGPLGPEQAPEAFPGPIPQYGPLQRIYENAGSLGLFADIIGSQNYAGPWHSYLRNLLPQAEQAYELQRLMQGESNLQPAGRGMAEVIRGLGSGSMPDVNALLQMAIASPEYRRAEQQVLDAGDYSQIAQMLETLRGSQITDTMRRATYDNPEFLASLIGQFTRQYPTGAQSAGAPTWLQYLMQNLQ